MSKIIYQEIYGIWGKEGEGIKEIPVCPRCNEPTYGDDKCPFCGEELEYE